MRRKYPFYHISVRVESQLPIEEVHLRVLESIQKEFYGRDPDRPTRMATVEKTEEITFWSSFYKHVDNNILLYVVLFFVIVSWLVPLIRTMVQ